ncbi:MAG: trypsin-like peptidase domain-containing protein [Nitrososphaerales archaeon]|nr:trypsin-like peptidase domain-containing protein [Nitrososphaerales archaeon]
MIKDEFRSDGSKNKLSSILWLIIIILIIGSLYTYFDIQTRYMELQNNYNNLRLQNEKIYYQLQLIESKLMNIESRIVSANLTISTVHSNSTEVFKRAGPSVVAVLVRIENILGTSSGGGSGFIYDRAGHIITNHHVIKGADIIRVAFPDGSSYPAKLVGTDPYSDLAVIKIDAPPDKLNPLPLGDSSKLVVGQKVVAIGNPFGLSNSMTEGIVSQLGRMLQTEQGFLIVDVIQVDAAINPGNSGGPLMNMNGEVIGVNTAIISPTGAFAGVGFAIPSNLVKKVVPSLIAKGKYEHPWLGITGINLTPEIANAMKLNISKGFLVRDVVKGGPADKAGIKGGNRAVRIEGVNVVIGGDVIVSIDGLEVRGIEDILVYLQRNKRAGEQVKITVLREGKLLEFNVILGERPPPS